MVVWFCKRPLYESRGEHCSSAKFFPVRIHLAALYSPALPSSAPFRQGGNTPPCAKHRRAGACPRPGSLATQRTQSLLPGGSCPSVHTGADEECGRNPDEQNICPDFFQALTSCHSSLASPRCPQQLAKSPLRRYLFAFFFFVNLSSTPRMCKKLSKTTIMHSISTVTTMAMQIFFGTMPYSRPWVFL